MDYFFEGFFLIEPTLTSDHQDLLVKFINLDLGFFKKLDEKNRNSLLKHWCPWETNLNGSELRFQHMSGQSGEYLPWLQYLIDYFFTPWNYSINGVCFKYDKISLLTQIIQVKNNKIKPLQVCLPVLLPDNIDYSTLQTSNPVQDANIILTSIEELEKRVTYSRSWKRLLISSPTGLP